MKPSLLSIYDRMNTSTYKEPLNNCCYCSQQITLHAFVPNNENVSSSYKGNQDFAYINHSGLYIRHASKYYFDC